MLRAVLEIGHYILREQPNGEWSVAHTLTPDKRISVHDNRDEAIAAAKELIDETSIFWDGR